MTLLTFIIYVKALRHLAFIVRTLNADLNNLSKLSGILCSPFLTSKHFSSSILYTLYWSIKLYCLDRFIIIGEN